MPKRRTKRQKRKMKKITTLEKQPKRSNIQIAAVPERENSGEEIINKTLQEISQKLNDMS